MPNRSYNNALIILRVGGFTCIALGSLGIAYIVVFVALWAIRAPEWLMGWTAPYVANWIIASPLYILLGCVVLAFSRRLARFIAIQACRRRSRTAGIKLRHYPPAAMLSAANSFGV